MNNLKMFCVTMNSKHLNFIKDIKYSPVGVGTDDFSKEFFRDNTGINISEKNKYYGEYTFHYWLWKNYLDTNFHDTNSWIGFCQYRKFWSINGDNLLPNSIDELKPLILTEIPKLYDTYDVILGEPYFINQLKIMKT